MKSRYKIKSVVGVNFKKLLAKVVNLIFKYILCSYFIECDWRCSDVTRSGESVNPIPRRNVGMKEESKASFYHMTMFALSSTILGRSVRARHLVANAKLSKMRLKTIACKFGTAITLKNLDFGGVLIFNQFLKLEENIKEIIF